MQPIKLDEHLWMPPAPPTSMQEALFSKELQRNQYWRRLKDYPAFFFGWTYETKLFAEHSIKNDFDEYYSLNRQDSKRLLELRDQELRRRKNGVWFMNNGELTYLTGGHYFMLQWGHLTGSINERTNEPFAEYREFQAHVHYFKQMVKEDPECIGYYILKPKKTGLTQLEALDMVDESTRMRGKWFGMMSKTLVPDCRDWNFMMYKNAFENLPNIMKPTIANENLTMIYFGNPNNNKNQAKKKIANANTAWLNTRVTALPTKANAFDGGMPFRAWTDELPKYEDPYAADLIQPTSAAMKMQSKVIGKWMITSYTPEDDKIKSKAQAEQLYYESMLRTKLEGSERTKSELYTYFISTIDSAQGSFDIYGKADRKKNQHWIVTQIQKLGADKDKLQAFHRANPTTVEEAWRSGGAGGSTFDNIRLGQRKFIIEEDLRVGQLPYVEVNLEWVAGDEKLVAIIPVTENDKLAGKSGLWRLYKQKYWHPDSLNESVRRKLYDRDKLLMPPENVRNIASMDPTNYAIASLLKVKSKNSMWVFNLPDSEMNAVGAASGETNPVTGRHIAEYLYRHDRPSNTLIDLKKMIYLFSCPIVIEGNMSWAVTKLIEDGLQNFVMVQDTKTKAVVPYDPNKHQGMITTQGSNKGATVNELIRVGLEYMAEPATPDDADGIETIDSEIALDQLMRFDPQETKAFDHAMGFLLGLQAMDNYLAFKLKLDAFKKRHNMGGLSKAVAALMDDD